jgi:hypothetical protein
MNKAWGGQRGKINEGLFNVILPTRGSLKSQGENK